MRRPFVQVDVFGDAPFTGNPLLVVLDGEGLTTEQMQRVADWATVAETTFVLPPSGDADYRVRIFTPSLELPFAGHPTLGTAHAWLSQQGRTHQPVVQECGAGLVQLADRGPRLSFAAPRLVRSGPLDGGHLGHLVSLLGLAPESVVDAAWVDNGPGWAALLLDGPEAVMSARPSALDCFVGLVGLYPPGHELAYEVRAFTPGPNGTPVEDPVTGSLNASVAEWLVAAGRARPPYVAGQGTALGRRGRIYIDQDQQGTIWVAGNTFTCLSGFVEI